MLLNDKITDPLSFPSKLKFVTNIQFKPGMGGTTNQRFPWRGVVIHWTGGERPAPDVISNLKDEGLSIHFIVDPDGTITQTADLSTRTSHCGPGNSYFIGIEVVCRGYASKIDLAASLLKNSVLRKRDQIDWDAQRDVYTDWIANEKVNLVAFNPEQVTAVVWLAEALAKQFGFPRCIPSAVCKDIPAALARMPVKNPSSYIVMHNGLPMLPLFDRDSIYRPSNYKGALCHFNIHPTKHCGGTQILYKLFSLGWNPAEVLLPDAQ